jgi:hypothetical protein
VVRLPHLLEGSRDISISVWPNTIPKKCSRMKLFVIRYVTNPTMKTFRLTLSALVGLAAVVGVQAADAKSSPRAEVNFSEPEKFADAADGQRGSDYGRDANLAELRDHIVRKANTYIPEGQKLVVTVTDVDLAGEIEPWRSPQLQDVRIIKEIYTPRIDLSYKLLDAGGAVVKEGKSQLRDLTFMMNINPNRNDPRIYEKALLDDWLRKEFGRAKK